MLLPDLTGFVFLFSYCGRECNAFFITLFFTPFYIALLVSLMLRWKKIKKANQNLKPIHPEAALTLERDVLGLDKPAPLTETDRKPGIKHPGLTFSFIALTLTLFISIAVISNLAPEVGRDHKELSSEAQEVGKRFDVVRWFISSGDTTVFRQGDEP